mmetsp:Transcript_49964/g.160612  ORF Transcript_49964/g.160612 Transcript_49964/m.160612 type:complete len:579 (-) Transcript_49964:202-1938(-)
MMQTMHFHLAALAFLLSPSLPVGSVVDSREGDACEGDASMMLQLLHSHSHQGRDANPLCAELSDGRLRRLAGGPYTEEDVGKVACHMAANVFENGTIIASPSRGTEKIHTYPDGSSINQNDYYYMWQRDAGLTMLTLLRVAKGGPVVTKQLENYASLYHEIWSKATPNKNCAPWGAGDGWCSVLGEPKFFVNGSVYDKPWGRNQNDGPAINAMVLMEVLSDGKADPTSRENAKADIISALKYVGGMGLDSTIDPWEMLYGQHYFVQSIQHRAMAMGADIAQKEGWKGVDNFPLWVPMLSHLVEQHWNATSGVIGETNARPYFKLQGPKCLSSSDEGANESTVRTSPCELDVAVLLGSLSARAGHGLGSAVQEVFPPHDSRMLVTAYHLVESMAPTYEVNSIDDDAGLPGVLIGRYPGDEYSGVIMDPADSNDVCSGYNCASAWFLATHGLAEFIYASADAAAKGDMKADGMNQGYLLAAMDMALPKAKRGRCKALPRTAKELAEKLIAGGDGVLARAKHHASSDLHMSEQIYRGNNKLPGVTPGDMIGARDLTWSYASLLDALAARADAVIAVSAMSS